MTCHSRGTMYQDAEGTSSGIGMVTMGEADAKLATPTELDADTAQGSFIVDDIER